MASVFIKQQINQFTNGLSIYNRDYEAHHRDGDRSNNFIENIQYVTRAQNMICAFGKAVVALAENKNAIPITYWTMNNILDYAIPHTALLGVHLCSNI